MRLLVVAPLLAAALLPATVCGATTTTSVAIRAGAPARLVAVPGDGPAAGGRSAALDGLRLIDASGGLRGWAVTASAQRLRDGDRVLPAGSLALDAGRLLDAGAAVLLARGGGGVWRPATGTRVRVMAPPGAATGRYTATVTLTLAIGP